MLLKKFLLKINNLKFLLDFLAILGTIATIFSAYIAYLAYFSMQPASSSIKGFDRFKAAASSVIAPQGYLAPPAKIAVVKENQTFALNLNRTVLLTEQARIPFAVKSLYSSTRVNVVLNGKNMTFSIGESESIPTTNCYLWLYSSENDFFSFEVRCPETS